MRRNYSDPSFWFFLPPESEPPTVLRRSNLIAIAILAFFSLGLLVAGFVHANASQSVYATHHAQQKLGHPAPSHHVR